MGRDTTHKKYHNVCNREIETGGADAGENEDTVQVFVALEILDSAVSLIKRNPPIYCKTRDAVEMKNLRCNVVNATKSNNRYIRSEGAGPWMGIPRI